MSSIRETLVDLCLARHEGNTALVAELKDALQKEHGVPPDAVERLSRDGANADHELYNWPLYLSGTSVSLAPSTGAVCP